MIRCDGQLGGEAQLIARWSVSGEEPDKPYSGRFVLRVGSELHRAMAIAAEQAGVSMNDWIAAVLEDRVGRPFSAKPSKHGRKATRQHA